MVASKNESLLSQFSRSSPDDGSAPDGVWPEMTPSMVDTFVKTSVALAPLAALPLCSSFSSIRSKLVKRVRPAVDGPPDDPLVVDPECFNRNIKVIQQINNLQPFFWQDKMERDKVKTEIKPRHKVW